MNKKSKEYSDRILNIRNEILQDIKSVFIEHKLSKIDISQSFDPTYVIWYDNNCNTNEGAVLAVYYKDSEIQLEIEANSASIIVYETDVACENPIWLNSIRDNILDMLEDDCHD